MITIDEERSPLVPAMAVLRIFRILKKVENLLNYLGIKAGISAEVFVDDLFVAAFCFKFRRSDFQGLHPVERTIKILWQGYTNVLLLIGHDDGVDYSILLQDIKNDNVVASDIIKILGIALGLRSKRLLDWKYLAQIGKQWPPVYDPSVFVSQSDAGPAPVPSFLEKRQIVNIS